MAPYSHVWKVPEVTILRGSFPPQISDDMLRWLEDNVEYPYRVVRRGGGYGDKEYFEIAFMSEDDALLYKLTWHK